MAVNSWNTRTGDVLPAAGDYTAALVNYTAPGSGAVTRTTQAKVQELVFSVKDFGATGDGTTDDRAAIVAAISAMGTAGGILYFPPGTYNVSSTITVPDNNNGVSCITVQGAGTYTTYITAKSGFGDPQILLVNGTTQIRDLSIAGKNQNTWAVRNRAANTFIDSVQFVSFGSLGGGFINDAYPGAYHLFRCVFGSIGTAIYNYDWGTGSTVRDCKILASGDAVIVTHQPPGGPTSSDEGINFYNNAIGSVGGHGVVINNALDFRFDNNGFTPIQSYASGKRGVFINGPATNLYFTNNWIEGLLATWPTQDAVVTNNTFPNGCELNLAGPTAGSMFNWRIANNRFQDGASGQQVILSNTTYIQFVNNQMVGGAGGIYIAGGGGSAGDHHLIMGNIFSGFCQNFQSATFILNTGGSGYTNLATLPLSW